MASVPKVTSLVAHHLNVIAEATYHPNLAVEAAYRLPVNVTVVFLHIGFIPNVTAKANKCLKHYRIFSSDGFHPKHDHTGRLQPGKCYRW